MLEEDLRVNKEIRESRKSRENTESRVEIKEKEKEKEKENKVTKVLSKIKKTKLPLLLCTKYTIIKKLGSGSFGEVYLAETKDKTRLAAKIEETSKKSRLENEYNTYDYLCNKGFTHEHGLPRVYDFIKTPEYNMMFMELLDSSLDDLHEKYNFNLNLDKYLSTLLKLSIELINLLQLLHNNNFIHRDIKPSNFLISNLNKKVYIIDLGLSKRYIKQNKHIDFTDTRSLIGTARYASINMHLGHEPSRRDDLESVGYMLIYFLKGKLPWQGLKKHKDKNKMSEIGEVKLSVPLSKLCSNLPDCFLEYLTYCRNLKFNETPNYEYLKSLFINYAKKKNIKLMYIWE